MDYRGVLQRQFVGRPDSSRMGFRDPNASQASGFSAFCRDDKNIPAHGACCRMQSSGRPARKRDKHRIQDGTLAGEPAALTVRQPNITPIHKGQSFTVWA